MVRFFRELRVVVLIGHDDDFAVAMGLLGDVERRQWSLQQEVVEVAEQCLEGVGAVVVERDFSLIRLLQPPVQR